MVKANVELRTRKKLTRRDWIFIIASAVIVLGIVAWFIVSAVRANNETGISDKEYQAVFLTNGQVYFGRLEAFRSDYKLTNVFYLQKSDSDDQENPQQPSSDEGNVQLIKLGNEVHGPQDEMVILRDQVLFFENLKSGSDVSKTIQQYNDK